MLERNNHKRHNFLHTFERHADIHVLSFVCTVLFLLALLFVFYGARGDATANFTMSILPQPLAVNIVDEDYNPIDEPEMDFTEMSYAPNCREVTTQLTSAEQRLYVRNFDAADGGWSVTISADDPTAVWSNGDYEFDFNDPTGDGCVDGDDADTLAGSMEIYTEDPLLDSWLCPSCSSDFVEHVTSWIFDEKGWINSVTLVYATVDSDNRGDWLMSDIMVRQTIPASQPAVGDYEIPLLLSITAN